MNRLDNVHVIEFDGRAHLILGDEEFVDLLPWSDASVLDIASRSDDARKICYLHAWNLRDEYLPTTHLLDARNDESNTLVKSNPEPRHSTVCDSKVSGLALVNEQRYHAAPAAHDVSISYTAEPGSPPSTVGIRLYEQLLSHELGGTVEVDRVDCLVRAECNHSTHTSVERRLYDIPRADDIGHDGFNRVVLA